MMAMICAEAQTIPAATFLIFVMRFAVSCDEKLIVRRFDFNDNTIHLMSRNSIAAVEEPNGKQNRNDGEKAFHSVYIGLLRKKAQARVCNTVFRTLDASSDVASCIVNR